MKRKRSGDGSTMAIAYLLLSALVVSVLSLEVDVDIEVGGSKDGKPGFYHPHEHLDFEYREHPELNPCLHKLCAEGEKCHVIRNPVMLQVPIALCEKEVTEDEDASDSSCSSFVLGSYIFQCKTESEWSDLAKKQCQIRLDVVAEGVFASVRYPCRFGRPSGGVAVFQQAQVSCCKRSSTKPTPAATEKTVTPTKKPAYTDATTEEDKWEKPTDWDKWGKPTEEDKWGKPTEEDKWGKPADWDYTTRYRPTTKEPVTKEPVTKEPVTKEPVTKEPVTKEPMTKEPVTKEPVTKEPVTKETVTEPKEFPTEVKWEGSTPTWDEWVTPKEEEHTPDYSPYDVFASPETDSDVIVEDPTKRDHPHNHHHLLWFVLPIVVVVTLCAMACITFCIVRTCMTRRRLSRVHKRFPADPPQHIFTNESFDDNEEEVYSRTNTGVGGYEPANLAKPVLIFRNDSNGDSLAYDMFIAGKQ